MRNISPVVEDDDIANKIHTHFVSDIADFPDIPNEETVQEWGFTKNSGNYSKPESGIPKSDLSSDVQALLNKMDTNTADSVARSEIVALRSQMLLAESLKAF